MQLGSRQPYFYFWLASLLLSTASSQHGKEDENMWTTRSIDIIEQTSGEESMHLMRSCKLCNKQATFSFRHHFEVDHATCLSHRSQFFFFVIFFSSDDLLHRCCCCSITTCCGRWECGLLDIAGQVLRSRYIWWQGVIYGNYLLNWSPLRSGSCNSLKSPVFILCVIFESNLPHHNVLRKIRIPGLLDITERVLWNWWW